MKIPTQIWIFCVGIFLQHYTFLQKRTFCILCENFSRFVRKATSVEKIEKSKYYQEYRKIYKYYKENVDYLSLKKDGIRSIDRSDAVPIDVYNQNESAIEKALDVLKSDTYSRDDKLKANEEILGFTVSVPKFRIDDYEIKKLKMPYTELLLLTAVMIPNAASDLIRKRKPKSKINLMITENLIILYEV